MKKLLRELEEAVVDAWPAAETEELDGWLLRASGGPTHRGNSVATLEAGPALPLATRIEQAEAWYAARMKPPMFQVGPAAAPAELDHALAERGYRKEGEAVAAVAALPEAVMLTALCGRALCTSVDPKPSAAWLELSTGASRFAATPRSGAEPRASTPEVFRGFLARLGSRCRFALARDAHGRPAASGLGISSEDRLGVYAMFTAPASRRQGAARAVLHALAQSALAERMRELYLLVELDNTPARELYAASGFRDLYQYHYRVLDRAPEQRTER
jgi:ribosomal protein S18 acetylase RimI-like enzyme